MVCFAKNLLLRLNEGRQSDLKDSQKRKISKLQGHSKFYLTTIHIKLDYLFFKYLKYFLIVRTTLFKFCFSQIQVKHIFRSYIQLQYLSHYLFCLPY